MQKRLLGQSGIEVSPIGLGCWAAGGHFSAGGKAFGYGSANDAETIRAIRRGMDLGLRVFDTSDAYGVGHSERVLGQALNGRRSEAVIVTKFGYAHNEENQELTGIDVSPDYIHRACEASLQRLGTDYIDLYLLHVWELGSKEEADQVADTLETLIRQGKIRSYGWSTDHLECARWFSEREGCCAIEQDLNVLMGSREVLELCREKGMASINRSPLAMGILSGKFTSDSLLGQDDVRGAGHEWVPFFKEGRPRPEFLKGVSAIQEILSSGGRSLVQGALGWLLAIGAHTVPIPGFKTVGQVEDIAGALLHGPLRPEQMVEIERLFGDIRP